jgi:hypothetical protein
MTRLILPARKPFNFTSVFASSYALFSGMVFLVAMGVLSTPSLHRFMHHFHLDLDHED